EQWMQQIARNLSDSESGALTHQKYLLHDHDTKFCSSFTATLSDGGVQPLRLPARSPNLNAFAERWVRPVKQECLSKLILFSEASLKRVLAEYLAHYHTERNHQGKHNLLLFPAPLKPLLSVHRSSAISVSAESFAITQGLHDFFDQTGMVRSSFAANPGVTTWGSLRIFKH